MNIEESELDKIYVNTLHKYVERILSWTSFIVMITNVNQSMYKNAHLMMYKITHLLELDDLSNDKNFQRW
ncbi:hypothetical protein [Sporosarcina sp. FSL K6-1508]|uniref:hypothetical protein n=1 Tax=Sporosarcina sp. FSL K6-1508 TaxID=2921553 RepID=UPI0040407B85